MEETHPLGEGACFRREEAPSCIKRSPRTFVAQYPPIMAGIKSLLSIEEKSTATPYAMGRFTNRSFHQERGESI